MWQEERQGRLVALKEVLVGSWRMVTQEQRQMQLLLLLPQPLMLLQPQTALGSSLLLVMAVLLVDKGVAMAVQRLLLLLLLPLRQGVERLLLQRVERVGKGLKLRWMWMRLKSHLRWQQKR